MQIMTWLKNIKNSRYFKSLKLLFLALFLTQCLTLQSVTQPSTGKAGEILTAVVQTQIRPAADESGSRLIIGFLAPKSWNARVNTTMTYTSNIGNGTMSRVPANLTPDGGSDKPWEEALIDKAGYGGNYIRDLEWVVFQSDLAYNIRNGQGDINIRTTVKTKIGPQNMVVQLGYVAATTTMDIDNSNQWGYKFSDCFTVTDGQGAVIDFCSPQLSLIEPTLNTDNDIVTINFDADAVSNALTNADKVYLCARGYTQNNQEIEVCGQEMKAQMTSLGARKWRLDLWPRGYFNVPSNQILDRIEYSFTDASGTKQVLDKGDAGKRFVYKFACE